MGVVRQVALTNRDTMKIVIVIIGIIAIAVVIAYVSGVFSTAGQIQENDKVTKKPSEISSTNTAPGTGPANEPPTTLTTSNSSAPASPPEGTSPGGKWEFGFTLDKISGSGLSRTVTARLSNLGPDDAHNVWGTLEGFSGKARIKLSGSQSIRIDVGTLKGGATVTRQLTLRFGLSDGLKILQNGARFILTVYSDEHSQAIPYDYQP